MSWENAGLFVDASHCPRTLAAGWGAWMKRDGWKNGLFFGGTVPGNTRNSYYAELSGIARALETAAEAGAMTGLSRLLLQCDNMAALELVLLEVPNAASHPTKGGIIGVATRKSKRKLSDGEAEAIDLIRSLAPKVGSLSLRHVKGHSRGGGRNWVNSKCDLLAKHYMDLGRSARTRRSPTRKKPALLYLQPVVAEEKCN